MWCSGVGDCSVGKPLGMFSGTPSVSALPRGVAAAELMESSDGPTFSFGAGMGSGGASALPAAMALPRHFLSPGMQEGKAGRGGLPGTALLGIGRPQLLGAGAQG